MTSPRKPKEPLIPEGIFLLGRPGLVEAGVLVEEIFPAESFAPVHFIHLAKSSLHPMNGGEDIKGVAGFRNGVHVANWESD